MSLRAVALAAIIISAAFNARAQEAIGHDLLNEFIGKQAAPESAWVDLRQSAPVNSRPQSAPDWIEAVTLVPVAAKGDDVAKTVFRIRVAHQRPDLQLLFV